MARYVYPHTIDNAAGEVITFLRRVRGTKGDRLEGENIATPGAGPGMHVHHYLEEVLTVHQGRIGYQRLGEGPQSAGPGQSIAFKPGEAHRFWNAGRVDLQCTGRMEPADNVEYLLTEIFESTKRSGRGRPGLFDIAFLARRYRSEYAVSEIPAVVQGIVFPMIVLVGRLLGRYARYADAPEPVRR